MGKEKENPSDAFARFKDFAEDRVSALIRGHNVKSLSLVFFDAAGGCNQAESYTSVRWSLECPKALFGEPEFAPLPA